MKKTITMMLIILMLLSGCSATKKFEKIAGVYKSAYSTDGKSDQKADFDEWFMTVTDLTAVELRVKNTDKMAGKVLSSETKGNRLTLKIGFDEPKLKSCYLIYSLDNPDEYDLCYCDKETAKFEEMESYTLIHFVRMAEGEVEKWKLDPDKASSYFRAKSEDNSKSDGNTEALPEDVVHDVSGHWYYNKATIFKKAIVTIIITGTRSNLRYIDCEATVTLSGEIANAWGMLERKGYEVDPALKKEQKVNMTMKVNLDENGNGEARFEVPCFGEFNVSNAICFYKFSCDLSYTGYLAGK